MDELYKDSFFSGLFLFVGCIFLFLEVFIPSGGILGILACASAGFGIFGFFYQDSTVLAVGSLGGFLCYGGFILYFVMKRVSFKASMTADTSSSVDERLAASLVGKVGTTFTALRPAGMAVIDDVKVDVVSAGDFVEKGAEVKVIEISGNRVVVRKIDPRS
jgi:membrane-bound serine protease (ClpP class)